MRNQLLKTVYEGNAPELKKLVVKYGMTPARSVKELDAKCNHLIQNFQKEFLKDLAAIHPDRELILWSAKEDEKTDTEKPETKVQKPLFGGSEKVAEAEINSNACGCEGELSNQTSNCSGKTDCGCSCSKEKSSNAIGDVLKNNMPLVIIGGLILIGGAIALNGKYKWVKVG